MNDSKSCRHSIPAPAALLQGYQIVLKARTEDRLRPPTMLPMSPRKQPIKKKEQRSEIEQTLNRAMLKDLASWSPPSFAGVPPLRLRFPFAKVSRKPPSGPPDLPVLLVRSHRSLRNAWLADRENWNFSIRFASGRRASTSNAERLTASKVALVSTSRPAPSTSASGISRHFAG
jgi:hypothetical protein